MKGKTCDNEGNSIPLDVNVIGTKVTKQQMNVKVNVNEPSKSIQYTSVCGII